MYTIVKIILEELAKNNLTYKDLAKRMAKKSAISNYSNSVKKMNEYFTGQYFNYDFTKNILDVLKIDETTVELALKIAKREQEIESWKEKIREYEKAYKNFTPHLRIVTEQDEPDNTAISQIAGANRIVRLPKNFSMLDETEKHVIVIDKILSTYSEYFGSYPFFGKILGFVYRSSFTKSSYFTTDADFVCELEENHYPIPDSL